MGKLDVVDTAELIGDSANPRTIAQDAASGLASSLDKFGDLSGIVYNKRTQTVVCGHQRLTQIREKWGDRPISVLDIKRELGGIEIDDTHYFPVRIVDWSKPLQRAANVAANSHKIAGDFTDDLDVYLSTIKEDLEGEAPGIYADLLFTEIEELVKANTPEVVEDEVPEPPAEPITKPGDLWLLGEHRILCGDSTKAEDVGRVMGGEKAIVCLTDPPYSVAYELQEREPGRKTRKDRGDSYRDPIDAEKLLTTFFCLMPTNAVTMTYAYNKNFQALAKATAEEWELLYECVWVKHHFAFVIGRRFQQKHEPILYFRRKKTTTPFHVDSNISTVFEHDKAATNPDHPTSRPMTLWTDLMGFQSQDQDIIYDPFLGSGTTLIAAEQLNRKCYGLEISPAYCDVIVERWQNLTGEKAKREPSTQSD